MEKPKLKHRNSKVMKEVWQNKPLTHQQRVFVKEYLIDYNQLRAGLAAGYTPNTARSMSTQLLKNPRVHKAIREALAEREHRLQVQFDDVARYWWDLANADARELLPVERSSCRHCYGEDFQFQYTYNELQQERLKHRLRERNLPQSKRTMLDEQGGGGYDFTKEPNPDCTECRGRGIISITPIDMKRLSRGAQLLFDGMKISKDGTIDIKLRDRSRAMENFQELSGYVRTRKPIADLSPQDMSDEDLNAAIESARSHGLLKLEDMRDNDKDLVEGEFSEVDP